MHSAQTSVAEMGEDAVLRVISRVFADHNAQAEGGHLVIGPGGDDAAVLTPAPGAQQVLTTDTMSEDQDFRRRWWAPRGDDHAAEHRWVARPDSTEAEHRWAADIGAKAAGQNLSDISAMGAEPTALLVSLTLPAETPVGWVEQFCAGIVRACRAPGAQRCVVAGGDLGSGELISVSITAVGELAAGAAPLRRSGARAGDVLAVCGTLGRAAAGLALLEAGAAAGESAAGEEHRSCIRAQLAPEPPLRAGPEASAAGASAAMDISDGLLRDGHRLAQASGVRLLLDGERLRSEAQRLEPVAASLGLPAHTAFDWVLSGGEDYGLLAAFPAEAVLPEGFRAIGRVSSPEAAAGEPGVSVIGADGSGEVSSGEGRGGWDSLRGGSPV
ncbi:thiamine-phosphate kinase [Nesterenkonia sp.]|uniref:thiamine-phosphate kinase n=1 Tax=Nesterenkonia sp. TaxID=704201 RepID=UPI0026098207|nr:thiamine-phosphate kinase [Nesterenkonia sp.]